MGCRVTNAAGAQLLKYVVTNGIKVISPPEPTYYPYDPIRLPDILDIGITNINVNFHSTPHFELDSDHIPVLISTDQIPPPHSPTPALNTYNLNWTKFKNLIQKQIPNFKILNSPAEIDQTISQLNNIIINTIGKLNPVRPITLRKHTADKLPQSIIKIIETKNKTRRLWMALRIPSLKKELNTLTKISRKALEHYKQTKYNNIIHSLNTSNNSLWNFTKRILRKKTIIPPLTTSNGKTHATADKTEVLADHFASTFTPNLTSPHPDHTQIQLVANSPNFNVPQQIKYITPQETLKVIKSLPNKKAPGHDKINNVILKNLPNSAIAFIVNIYNSSLRTGYYPNTWKHSIILPIPKPNKNHSIPDNYRPISLLPT